MVVPFVQLHSSIKNIKTPQFMREKKKKKRIKQKETLTSKINRYIYEKEKKNPKKRKNERRRVVL